MYIILADILKVCLLPNFGINIGPKNPISLGPCQIIRLLWIKLSWCLVSVKNQSAADNFVIFPSAAKRRKLGHLSVDSPAKSDGVSDSPKTLVRFYFCR